MKERMTEGESSSHLITSPTSPHAFCLLIFWQNLEIYEIRKNTDFSSYILFSVSCLLCFFNRPPEWGKKDFLVFHQNISCLASVINIDGLFWFDKSKVDELGSKWTVI